MKGIAGLVLWLGVTFVAAFVGSRFMPGEWYGTLAKPSWNPPSWVFGPVWTLLYIMMAVAAWLVWRERGAAAGVTAALTMFVLQLVLNAAWSWLFFGRHTISGALLDIVALWLGIVVTIVLFWRVRPLAGALLLPYVAWVSFAAFLNYTLWQLNRG